VTDITPRGIGSCRSTATEKAARLDRLGRTGGEPPHDPKDRRPRLEIAFGVNAERWLVATVTDLLTRKELMSAEPVVRLI
jgi:hypothetical protein